MKTTLMSILLLVACVGSRAQEMPPQPEAELKAISYLVGEFETTDTMHMPDGSKMESKGKATSKWALMDRYVHMMVAGEMGPGMKFEGMFMITYNEVDKQYEASWFDSMGGQSIKAKGQITDGKLVLTSDTFKYMEQEMTFRLTYSKIDDKSLSFMLEMKIGEEWMTQLSSVYKKK